MLKLILQFIKNFKFLIILLLISSVTGSFLVVYVNKYIEIIINSINENPGGSIAFIILSFIFFKILSQIPHILQNAILAPLLFNNINFFVSELFLKISSYSMGFFLINSPGVLSRKIDDFQSGFGSMIWHINTIIITISLIIFSLISVFQIDKNIGYSELLFLFLFGCIQFFLLKKYTLLVKNTSLKKQQSFSKIQNSLEILEPIKIFGNIDFFFNNYLKNDIKEFAFFQKKSLQFDAFIIQTTNFFLITIAICIQVYLLTSELNQGNISTGNFAFAFTLILALKNSLRNFISKLINYSQAFGRFSSSFEIFHDSFLKTSNDQQDIKKYSFQEIELKNVQFMYPGEKKVILKNLNFKIKSNENLGVICSNEQERLGLINILARFFDILEGEILIDNLNINNIKIESFWGQIGIISQETKILNSSIIDNFLIAKPDATIEEIELICKKVDFYDDIMKMENKFDTVLENNFSNLSKEQKQKIGIARVLLRNPKILILDEITASLDLKAEKKILKIIQENFYNKNIMIIFITNKIQNLEYFEKIIEIQDCEIIKIGKYDQFE